MKSRNRVISSTISDWVKQTLEKSGIDNDISKPIQKVMYLGLRLESAEYN